MSAKVFITFALGLILSLALPGSRSLADDNNDVVARINVSREPNGIIKIQPACRAMRSMVVAYSLDLNKQGKQGNSVSRQSGVASLKPNQDVSLCRISINLPRSSKCLVKLVIRHEGRVISEQEILLSDSNPAGSI